MLKSDELKDLTQALCKAQASMKPAIFNRVNPHFKSRYADFASCMDACRSPLADNGLAVTQCCETRLDKSLVLVTTLLHISGQWMQSEFPIISTRQDSQGIGSAMTYAKRYSLCAMIGIVADEEDDDAESAMGRGVIVSKPSPEKKFSQDQVKEIVDLKIQLDAGSNNKLSNWLEYKYKTSVISELPIADFEMIHRQYKNAAMVMIQQSKIDGGSNE